MSIIRNGTTEGKKKKIGIYKKNWGSTYCITTCVFWQMKKRHLMVSEMEPRYQSSKTAMLQTFICHLPNSEYSFILPVKFSLGASLPAQNSSRLPGLRGSHQGHPLAGTQFRNYLCLCPGLSGALRWQALPKHASRLQMLGLLLPSTQQPLNVKYMEEP